MGEIAGPLITWTAIAATYASLQSEAPNTAAWGAIMFALFGLQALSYVESAKLKPLLLAALVSTILVAANTHRVNPDTSELKLVEEPSRLQTGR